jgi:hypothetical protein
MKRPRTSTAIEVSFSICVPFSVPHGMDKIEETLYEHLVLLPRVFYPSRFWDERTTVLEKIYQSRTIS